MARGLYSIGGNREVAARTGYNWKALIRGLFALIGFLAAFAGVVAGALDQYFSPLNFSDRVLNIIAAVIIGGASIWGGRGTVIGAILGVVLLEEIQRVLIYLGITADWQRLVTGLALIIFIAIPAITKSRISKASRVTAQLS